MASTIIIRLQNLPLSAKASDIRDFFSGLRIPEGQVNIVGGPQGDAFIGFASDEDARRAMNFDGRDLHTTKIKLFLSSKLEMEQVIANARAMAAAILGRSLDPFIKQAMPAATKLEPPKPPELPVYKPEHRSIKEQIKPEGASNEHGKETTKFPSDSWKLPPSKTISSYASNTPLENNGYSQDNLKTDLPVQEYHGFFNKSSSGPKISQNSSLDQSSYQSNPKFINNTPYNGPAQINPTNLHVGLLPTPTNATTTKIDPFPAVAAAAVVAPTMTPNLQAFNVSPAFLPGFGPQSTQVIPPPPSLGIEAPLYVQLRRLPNDLLRPTALEQFLRPNIPLTLSAVKVIFDVQGNPLHSLVRFSDVEDARRILDRDGELGIRIRQCTRKEFDEAVDGSLGVIPAGRDASPPRRTRRYSPPARAQQLQKRRHSPPQRDEDRFRRRPRMERTERYNRSPTRKSPEVDKSKEHADISSDEGRNRQSQERQFAKHKEDGEKYNKDLEYRSERRRSRSPRRRRDTPTERICLELKNLPHKATHRDLEDYIRGAKAYFVKCTRTYYEGGWNKSDRWVVEFDNQRDADAVLNYNRPVNGREVRVRFITPREADDLYAIPEPDARGNSGSGSYNSQKSRENGGSHNQRSNYQPQPLSDPTPLFPEFRRNSDTCNERDRNGSGFDNRYDNRSSMQPPPLSATTETELIVRGDLPPTSFGAFSAPSTATSGYFKRATAEVKVAGLKNFRSSAPGVNNQRGQFQSSGPGQQQQQSFNSQGQGGFKQQQKIDHDQPVKQEETSWAQNKSNEKTQMNWERVQSSNGQFDRSEQFETKTYLDKDNQTMKNYQEPASDSISIMPNLENEPPEVKVEEDLPKLPFFESTETTSELKSCLHLKNIQQKISSERLCIFLGVVLERPSDNVFWMPEGDLYVNLSNEQLADKAASKNGRPLDGRLISVERVTRGKMAKAIIANISHFIDKKT